MVSLLAFINLLCIGFYISSSFLLWWSHFKPLSKFPSLPEPPSGKRDKTFNGSVEALLPLSSLPPVAGNRKHDRSKDVTGNPFFIFTFIVFLFNDLLKKRQSLKKALSLLNIDLFLWKVENWIKTIALFHYIYKAKIYNIYFLFPIQNYRWRYWNTHTNKTEASTNEK